jgi:hypothetical protein
MEVRTVGALRIRESTTSRWPKKPGAACSSYTEKLSPEMPGDKPVRVFISYARKDAADLARQ